MSRTFGRIVSPKGSPGPRYDRRLRGTGGLEIATQGRPPERDRPGRVRHRRPDVARRSRLAGCSINTALRRRAQRAGPGSGVRSRRAAVRATDYGVWGVLVVSLGVLARLKLVGISDKYIQQDEADQELAFQRAFTLEVLVTALAMVPLAAALPVVAVVYGQWKLVPRGGAPDGAGRPMRCRRRCGSSTGEMDFVRQRALRARRAGRGVRRRDRAGGCRRRLLGARDRVLGGRLGGRDRGDPCSSLPAALALRPGRRCASTPRSPGPLFVATLCSVILANATAIATNAHLGLAGVGASRSRPRSPRSRPSSTISCQRHAVPGDLRHAEPARPAARVVREGQPARPDVGDAVRDRRWPCSPPTWSASASARSGGRP